MTRQRRGGRGPDDERDKRDERRSDDPRDVRDPRLPGDPYDAATAAGAAAAERAADRDTGVPRFVKFLAAIGTTGLAVVSIVAWQVSELRHAEAELRCQRAVAAREDSRAMWLYLFDSPLIQRDRDDPNIVAFVEYLDDRLPPLQCVDTVPTKVDPRRLT